MPAPRIDFDPDFASNAEWAAMYRQCGLQVVPGRLPTEEHWKAPRYNWKEFQDELVSQERFEQWFATPPHGQMGVICGRASGGVFVVDLDTYKTPAAAQWWLEVAGQRPSDERITAEQRTGGGGRQLFYRAPAYWTPPQGSKADLGVDIRGQGGYAILPPTKHTSGNEYQWLPGQEIWNGALRDAPTWLMNAIDRLEIGKTSSHSAPAGERVAATGAHDAFGNITDGREDYMTRVVWGAVLDLYREAPIPPSPDQSLAAMRAAYEVYARKATTRLPGEERERGLEREGRGLSYFQEKWDRAMAQWDGKVAQEASQPRPLDESATPREEPVDPETGERFPLVLSAAQFVKGFTRPEYLIDGMMQRGYLYSLTARTGHGKTAVSMYLAQCIARGEPIKTKEVMKGSVLLLAGENPDDIRARFLVLAEKHGFDPRNVPIHFVAGVVNIAESLPIIREAAAGIGDLALVIVDTAAAYYTGDDGNSNAQQGEYARVLRQLSFLPGKPAVLVNSHPVKNASKDNLVPVGGGAFLNEVDGNLTLWSAAEGQTTLHWQGKFRGPEFEPLTFRIETVTSDAVRDAKDRHMPSVVALPMSEFEIQAGEAKQETDENIVLSSLAWKPGLSQADIARRAKWVSENGTPHKSKVNRILQRLNRTKLVEETREGKYRITAKGKREIGVEDDD